MSEAPAAKPFKPLDNQQRGVDDVVSKIIIYRGGYRSGKTVFEVMKCVDLGIRNWPHPILFVAPAFPYIRDVFVREAQKMCALWGFEAQWISSKKILLIHTADVTITIICRSADAPRSIEGLTVAAVVIDEWELCPIEAVTVAMARRSLPCAVPQIVLGGTPEGFGPGYHLLERRPRKGTRVIVSKTIDNPHNDDDYVNDTAATLSNEGIQEKLLGERTMPAGRVYSRFDRRLHCTKPCVVDARHGHLEVWCDFGVSPMAWGFFQVDREAKLFHCVGELVVKGTDSERQAAEATLWVQAWKRKNRLNDTSHRGMWAICDAAGTYRQSSSPISDVMNLHRAGFSPIHASADPPVEDRVASVQRALGGPNPLGGSWPVHLTFDEEAAPYIVSCLSGQKLLKNGAPDKENGLDHGADLTGYGVMQHWPTEAPRPQGMKNSRSRAA